MMVQAPLFPLSLWVDKVNFDESTNIYLSRIHFVEHSFFQLAVFLGKGAWTKVWKRARLAFLDRWSTTGSDDVLP